jgi:hypothetical protein
VRAVTNVVVVECFDGTAHAYAYPDAKSANSSFEENRSELDARGMLVFYVRERYGTTSAIHAATFVANLWLTSREAAEASGIEPRAAVVYG